MANEQKLREALRIAVNYIDMDALYTFAGGDHDTIKEALATTEPTSKQSLQVEPAVNQQLTTEPLDEREAFEKWVTKNGEWPNNALRSCLDPDRYANFDIQGLWGAWQARAAMAQGVKG